MWGADNDFLQQFAINFRFVFPDIDNGIRNNLTVQSVQKGLCLNNFSTGRINDERVFVLVNEKSFRLPNGMFYIPLPYIKVREGDDVTFFHNLI